MSIFSSTFCIAILGMIKMKKNNIHEIVGIGLCVVASILLVVMIE